MTMLLMVPIAILLKGGFFNWPSPISGPKKKTVNQPISHTAVSENPVTKKGHDWLLGNFLLGTEIGEGQLDTNNLLNELTVIKWVVMIKIIVTN